MKSLFQLICAGLPLLCGTRAQCDDQPQKNRNTIKQSRVFVRADLNVVFVNGKILDDYRLEAIRNLLDTLIDHNNVVILATHIGRPNGKIVSALSTKNLIPWFKQKGYQLFFENDFEKVKNKSYPKGSIVLLENLRFWPGEQKGDSDFAQKLADLADYYINDAFALLHRNDTSITLTPKLFSKEKIFFGPLIEKEIHNLDKLKNPEHPYLVILGGGKVTTKLPLIEHLLDVADMILLSPAIVFTFMKALGQETGKSLIDEEALNAIPMLLQKAKEKNVELLFPVDYQVAIDSLDGPLQVVDADSIPKNGIGIAFGPKTIEKYRKYILNAPTIFVNAAMGFPDKPNTMEYLGKLIHELCESSAFKVAGGGETVAAIQKFNADQCFNFLSTGGGATLAYLAGQKLPGLQAMKN